MALKVVEHLVDPGLTERRGFTQLTHRQRTRSFRGSERTAAYRTRR